MPDPKTSNRERLLRLIDGGTDALRELQDEPVKPVAPKAPSEAARLLKGWRTKFLSTPPAEMKRLLKWLAVAVVILAGLYYGLGILRTLQNRPASVGASAAVEDESGTGLRLVGVDSSGPPVALLEDLKTGKTYFAKVNDRVKDVRVKQIEKNKVAVSFRGKTVELR